MSILFAERRPATRTEARRRVSECEAARDKARAAQNVTLDEIAAVRAQLSSLAAGHPTKLTLAERLADLRERADDQQSALAVAADRLFGARVDLALFDVTASPAERQVAA